MMTATFIGSGNETINSSHRKEEKYTGGYLVVVHTDSGLRNPIDLRYYWTDSRCYCCVWINGQSLYSGGSGYAGGYGCDKASAAASVAIDNAGWMLSERISGVGSTATEEALRAITLSLYPDAKEIMIIQAHA